MTKSLPIDANIGWLRKAAKTLQKSWKADGRDTRLADAQFAIAQDYGFASWRALKSHFDAGDPDQIKAFLRDVGLGNIAAMESALQADPSLANATGAHPFWGGQPCPLHVAIDTNREDAFDVLITAGADVNNAGMGYDNWSPLMLALSWGRTAMIKMSRTQGAHENLCTALLDADDSALDRHLANDSWRAMDLPSGSLIGLARTPHAVHALMAAGVSPDGTDRWGSTAMDALSRLGDKGRDVVAALATHGAAPSAEDLARLNDWDALKVLAGDDPTVLQGPKVTTAAVDFCHLSLLEWLLDNGADVNARHDFGSKGTALHSAAWNGDSEIVQCLLDHGADVTAIDEEHKTTPLIWAQTARKVTNNPACDAVVTLLADHMSKARPNF